jgi:hypothetical protein
MSEDRAVRHLERVEWAPNRGRPPELHAWPYSIPAVAQLISEGGLDIDPGVRGGRERKRQEHAG